MKWNQLFAEWKIFSPTADCTHSIEMRTQLKLRELKSSISTEHSVFERVDASHKLNEYTLCELVTASGTTPNKFTRLENVRKTGYRLPRPHTQLIIMIIVNRHLCCYWAIGSWAHGTQAKCYIYLLPASKRKNEGKQIKWNQMTKIYDA